MGPKVPFSMWDASTAHRKTVLYIKPEHLASKINAEDVFLSVITKHFAEMETELASSPPLKFMLFQFSYLVYIFFKN